MNTRRSIRNTSEATAPRYLEATFNDVDHFGEAIASSGLQLTQLSPGIFQGQISSCFVNPSLNINRYKISQSIQVVGDKYSGRLIFAVLINQPSPPAFSHDRLLVENAIFGFDRQRSAHLVTSPEGQEQCHIEVSRALFQHYAILANRYDLDDAFLQRNIRAISFSTGPKDATVSGEFQ